MKVSIGINLINGPWGGGNQFACALADYLRGRGDTVCFDLEARDIDLIVLTDPRKQLQSCAFDDADIFNYLEHVNPRALVVHRVNECDERKGTQGLNARLKRASLVADHTVFVGEWLRDLHSVSGWPCSSTGVVRNGSDSAVFYADGHVPWDGNGPLRLVTHHWGNNWNKGFDIYRRLDDMLAASEFASRYAFTYIGKLPPGFEFVNAIYVEPCHGEELATRLRSQHAYLTASRFEPGGHHQNEGAACGLPLLFRESGCLPEYCDGFGISFTSKNFTERLEVLRTTYNRLQPKMAEYPHTAEKMCEEYAELFSALLESREHLLAARSSGRRLRWLKSGFFAAWRRLLRRGG